MQESRRDYRDLTSEPLSHDAQAVINARPQHTPGPWAVVGVGRYTPKPAIVTATGLQIAIVDAEAAGDEVATARLIAAAPDLLAALEAVQRASWSWPWQYREGDAFKAVDAAIAKARGQ